MWEYLGKKLFSTKVEINLKSQLEKKIWPWDKNYCNKNKRELDPRKGKSRIFRKRHKLVMRLIDFLSYKGISVKVLQEDSPEVCQFLSIAALLPIRTVSEKRPWLSSERKSTLTKTKLLDLFKYCPMLGKIVVNCPSRWSLYLSLALRGADQHPTKRLLDTAMF